MSYGIHFVGLVPHFGGVVEVEGSPINFHRETVVVVRMVRGSGTDLYHTPKMW